MQYVSTRGHAPKLGFEEAMLAGLARDGGLYLPESWPRLSDADIAGLAGLAYEEVAFRVMRPYLGEAFGEAEFRAIVARAYAGSTIPHAARCVRPGRTTGCWNCSTGRRSPSRTWRCSSSARCSRRASSAAAAA
jgi:threonine synthase